MKQESKFTRFSFILNGFLFFLGGWALFNDDKFILGVIQCVAAFVNISMTFDSLNKKTKVNLNYVVLIMNIIVCISTAIDYFLLNKAYIQYAWLIAAVISFLALILKLKKEKSYFKTF